jgi:hypothetical protein
MSSGFTLLSSQRVRHKDGYIIEIVDRETVHYIEPNRRASVYVDFATLTGIYRDTLSPWRTADGTTQMNAQDRRIVLERVADGLRAMGLDVEIC